MQAFHGDFNTAFGAHAGGAMAGLMLAPLFVKRGVLIVAPPLGDTEHWREYPQGFAVPWPVAAGIAALLVGGLGYLLVTTQKNVDPQVVANARQWIAVARLKGWGVPLDAERGLAAYRAAATEDPIIGARLAGILLEGTIVPKNDEEAVQWYERSAKINDPGAVTDYALMLIDGNGVARDRDRGLAMLLALANDGFASADLQLGQVLEFGRGGVDLDVAGAAQRYKHACDNRVREPVKSTGQYDACRRYAQMLKDAGACRVIRMRRTRS